MTKSSNGDALQMSLRPQTLQQINLVKSKKPEAMAQWHSRATSAAEPSCGSSVAWNPLDQDVEMLFPRGNCYFWKDSRAVLSGVELKA